jgi:hypothetical protein
MTMPLSLRLKEVQPVSAQSSPSMQNFPSSLRLKEKQPEKQQEQEFPSFEEDEREEERARAQLTSRMIETILGAPGDIASFGAGLFGKEQEIFPTSGQLREKSESLSQGYTKPKTEFEEDIGELASDVASLALPGAKHYSFARNIGIPAVANLVKEGLKYGNADEQKQAYGKVGTLIALDLISGNKGGVKKHLNTLYEKAEAAVPKGVSYNAGKLEKALTTLETELSKGGKRATSIKAMEKVSEIKNEIKNGKIDIKRLAAYRPSINEAIEELGGFNLDLPKKLKKVAIRNLNQVKHEVIGTLNNYGHKVNPEFLKYHQAANEGYAAYSRSHLIGNFIKDKVAFVPQTKAVQAVFGYAPIIGIAGTALKAGPGTAFGATAAYGGYQGIKVLHQIMNSPTLRKYYTNVLKEAAAGNVAATTKNLKALDANMDQAQSDHENINK